MNSKIKTIVFLVLILAISSKALKKQMDNIIQPNNSNNQTQPAPMDNFLSTNHPQAELVPMDHSQTEEHKEPEPVPMDHFEAKDHYQPEPVPMDHL